MATIKQLRADIEAKLTHARALDMTGTRAEIHEASEVVLAAKQLLSDSIADGSKPCPDCGEAPHGMVQDVMVRKQITPIFEVGCLSCRDHRAQGFTPELAVENWNAGPESWLPASTGPGIKDDREKVTLTADDVATLKV